MSEPHPRDAAQAGVDADGHVVLERLPARLAVARPEERRKTLHAWAAVSMERVDALIGAVHLVAFEVHAVARHARGGVEAVALVGPPAVDADVHQLLVRGPVAADVAVGRPFAVGRAAGGQRRRGARVGHFAEKLAAFDDDVQHHFEIPLVQLLDGGGRVGESFQVPVELAVVRVPAVGAEAGAEVDHHVAGQLLVAHQLRLGHDLFGLGQRAVRLLVAERPQRRHLRVAGEFGVLRHHAGGLFRADHEHVERQSRFGRGRDKLAAFFVGEVERAHRLVNEERPAACADGQLHRHLGAVRGELEAALAAAHAVQDAALVELRSALPQPEQRRVAGGERHCAGLRVDLELLHQASALAGDADGQRAARHAYRQLAALLRAPCRTQRAHLRGGLAPILFHQRAVGRHWHGLSVFKRLDGDAHRFRANGGERYFHRASGDFDGCLLAESRSRACQHTGAGAPQSLSSCHAMIAPVKGQTSRSTDRFPGVIIMDGSKTCQPAPLQMLN